MAEDTLEKEPQTLSTCVALEDGAVGFEIKRPGVSFELRNMFSKLAAQLGGDKFSKVYFRTETPNIFLLNNTGELINRGESIRKGRIVAIVLSREELEKQKLTVGEPFSYGKGVSTAPITEIVPTNERSYASDYLKRMTGGKTNKIVEDFRRNLPPIPNPTRFP